MKFLISYKNISNYVKARNLKWKELDKEDFKAINLSARTQEAIRKATREMAEFLIEKNLSYGSSITEPLSIFSSSDRKEQIRVRFDDKLNRIIKGQEFATEDAMKDLAGYGIMFRVVEILEEEEDD